jgi:uncharacterized FlgJ-related protein
MHLFTVPVFTLHAQSKRIKEVSSLYDSLRSHKIEHPKTVLAIAIYETGWMQCKSCALEYNNLFGFRTNKDFLKFSSTTESIRYLKRWQSRYYQPWKARNPEGTYYEYLRYIRYCDNMDSYIQNIKNIEQWLSVNIEGVK